MKKIEKMFQVGGKISGRSGYRKHNIFLLRLRDRSLFMAGGGTEEKRVG